MSFYSGFLFVLKRTKFFSSLRSSLEVFHSGHFWVSSTSAVKNVTTIHDPICETCLVGERGNLLNLYECKKFVVDADSIIGISKSTS